MATKLFKNNEERERTKKFVTWILNTYKEVSEANMDLFKETLSELDCEIITQFGESLTDDDGNEVGLNEILHSMMMYIINNKVDLEQSDLYRLNSRTNKQFKTIVKNGLGDKMIPDVKPKKEEEKIEETKTEEKEEGENKQDKAQRIMQYLMEIKASIKDMKDNSREEDAELLERLEEYAERANKAKTFDELASVIEEYAVEFEEAIKQREIEKKEANQKILEKLNNKDKSKSEEKVEETKKEEPKKDEVKKEDSKKDIVESEEDLESIKEEINKIVDEMVKDLTPVTMPLEESEEKINNFKLSLENMANNIDENSSEEEIEAYNKKVMESLNAATEIVF